MISLVKFYDRHRFAIGMKYNIINYDQRCENAYCFECYTKF